jgi:probable addiction module antidote protein
MSIVKYNEYLHKELQNDQEAKAYINASLEEFFIDHNKEMFLAALKNVIEARGGISEISRKARLNRQHLYRMLSAKGNPSFDNIGSLLTALGLKLTVEPNYV